MQFKPLKNVKHELFCQHVAMGKTAVQAYEFTHPGVKRSTAETNGPRTLRLAQCRARVDYLTRQAAQLTETTLTSLIAMAKDTWAHSMAEKQLSAAAQAMKELGILTGHRIERRENKAVRDVRKLEDEELLEIIHAERARRVQQDEPSTQSSTHH
jgi:hypothetical protein